MIVPDANLLLYAYDQSNPFHEAAATWWSRLLSGSEPVGLCSVVLFAFVRLGTSNRVFARPMTIQCAAGHVRSWLKRSVVEHLSMDDATAITALRLLENAGAGGNLTTDAQIAAVALRHRATVHTADSDFARFPDLRWGNPLLARGSRER